MRRAIRNANCSGFHGDRIEANAWCIISTRHRSLGLSESLVTATRVLRTLPIRRRSPLLVPRRSCVCEFLP
jgi:hypothetical protein